MIETLTQFRKAYVVTDPTKEQVEFLSTLGGRIGSKRRVTNWPSTSYYDPQRIPRLFSNPVYRVHQLWYSHYYHSGLSPFAYASLFDTTPEVILEEAAVERNVVAWTFCSTTALPVSMMGGVHGRVGDAFISWYNSMVKGTGYWGRPDITYENLRFRWASLEAVGNSRKFTVPSYPGVVREGIWNNLKRAAQLRHPE